jgi:hypothetical protein
MKLTHRSHTSRAPIALIEFVCCAIHASGRIEPLPPIKAKTEAAALHKARLLKPNCEIALASKDAAKKKKPLLAPLGGTVEEIIERSPLALGIIAKRKAEAAVIAARIEESKRIMAMSSPESRAWLNS